MRKQRVAVNDSLIEILVSSPNFIIHKSGTVWRLVHGVWKRTGKAKTSKNGKIYNHLKFQGRMVLVHRIVYRKFQGILDIDMVINHIDGNSLNNSASNLELITQQMNCMHSMPGWKKAEP